MIWLLLLGAGAVAVALGLLVRRHRRSVSGPSANWLTTREIRDWFNN